MLVTAIGTIFKNLDHIPDEDNETNVAIACFNVFVCFFSLPSGQSERTMLVIFDFDDVFLPKTTGLLLNLAKVQPLVSLFNFPPACLPYYKCPKH